SPTSLLDSTPPTCHAEESEDSDTTARMAVRVSPVMSPSLSANIAEVAAMSDSVFCKRFRSSYESSPSSSSPDLLSRKRSWGTSELVEDDNEEDEDEEEEEVEESSDSDSESEDAEDEGPVARDEGLAVGDKGPSIIVESLGLGRDEAVPEGQQQAAPVIETDLGQGSRSVPEPKRPERVYALRHPTLTTWIYPEDGRAYIDVPAYPPPTPPVQTPPSPEWSSSSLPISPAPSNVEMHGGLIYDHTIRLGELSPALFKRYDKDIGELFTRPVLALESWAGQMDAQRVALWHAISDTQMENRELRLQIIEERHARLDLAKIVDSMGRGQEPRGDV
ncbi:hypothetical protein Tco_1081752, partial [Tanacetum coccineum]